MPKYTFVHSHECGHKGEVVHIRPPVHGSYYDGPNPYCIDTGIQLELVQVEGE
jgi:hypothetical protein